MVLQETTIDIRKEISKLPSDGIWWKNSNREMLIRMAELLIDQGIRDKEAYMIIKNCYEAVASEYGN